MIRNRPEFRFRMVPVPVPDSSSGPVPVPVPVEKAGTGRFLVVTVFKNYFVNSFYTGLFDIAVRE